MLLALLVHSLLLLLMCAQQSVAICQVASSTIRGSSRFSRQVPLFHHNSKFELDDSRISLALLSQQPCRFCPRVLPAVDGIGYPLRRCSLSIAMQAFVSSTPL